MRSQVTQHCSFHCVHVPSCSSTLGGLENLYILAPRGDDNRRENVPTSTNSGTWGRGDDEQSQQNQAYYGQQLGIYADWVRFVYLGITGGQLG